MKDFNVGTHTFRISLSQRYIVRYKHKDKQPSPPRLSHAARLVASVLGIHPSRCTALVNSAVPFNADFAKMTKIASDLSDAGYKFEVVN